MKLNGWSGRAQVGVKGEVQTAGIAMARMVASLVSVERVQDSTHRGDESTEISTINAMDHGAIEQAHGTFPQAFVRGTLNQPRQDAGSDRRMRTWQL